MSLLLAFYYCKKLKKHILVKKNCIQRYYTSMQNFAYPGSCLVDLVGLVRVLGKFIEIDCLFRRNRPKNPASGGWGGLPQTPRLAFFGNTSACLVLYIYYNLLKIISGRQGHWRNHCCVLLYCISSFFIKYPVQYCTYHYRILIFDIQLDRADTSPRLRDILSSIAEPSAHPRAFYDRL